MNLKINNKTLQEKSSIKYLGIIFDHYLNWKEHVSQLSKKISRGIGILSKLRHFVPIKILLQIYYSIIYPFLSYGVIIWGNTYNSNILPLVTLQKKALIRIITFSDFRAHASHFLRERALLKLVDIIYLNTALFMYDHKNGNLPDNFFSSVSARHNYETRLATKNMLSIPQVRTNYRKFNIRFIGPKT